MHSHILVGKIVPHKPQFLGEAKEDLKHHYAHNLRDPYFRVVAKGQCLASPDSESFTQFRGWLAMMFGSQVKHAKATNSTSAAVTSKEISGVTSYDQQLSHNSCRHQNKNDA